MEGKILTLNLVQCHYIYKMPGLNSIAITSAPLVIHYHFTPGLIDFFFPEQLNQ